VKRAAIYLRVSTARKSLQGDMPAFDQNPEVQEQPLRELVAQRGWVPHRIYSDRASGAKERRPGLDSLMADARRGRRHGTSVLTGAPQACPNPVAEAL